jgi:hypothetical protein
VKRGADGLDRVKKVVRAARFYSFFTIDVSDVLDYTALSGGTGAAGEDAIERLVDDERTRRDVRSFYRDPLRVGGRSLRLSESELSALVGKYWHAMEALAELVPFIQNVRGDEPFDLELSIDEHPPEVQAFDCLTTELELGFIVGEARRRGISLSHIAPNLGVEKHFDYRYEDGLEGLEARTRTLHELASEAGAVIDCHSGDDLCGPTREALRRATGGMIHFKVSPRLQDLFADVLYEFDRDLFRVWWDDTFEFVAENARQGSSFAQECLRSYGSNAGEGPNPKHALFRVYCYATVGKRDTRGDFVYRDRFYSLSREFYAEYTSRVSSYLCMLARELL